MTRFSAGDHVQVLALGKEGHVRIPHYIRHQTGRVSEYCGTYLNPEDLAVGNTSGRAVTFTEWHFCKGSFGQMMQSQRKILLLSKFTITGCGQ